MNRKSGTPMMISIVIPAYDEEKRIEGSLSEACAYMNDFGMEYEIIVVDDGSSDGTGRIVDHIAKELRNVRLVRYEKNRGKGHALRTGVLVTEGDFVLVMDADLSTPMEELRKLLPYLSDDEFDIAIGSRALALSDIIKKQPWWRRGMGKTFNKIVKTLVIDGFSDTQCGFKLFKGEIARGLFEEAKIDRFAYDVEILALAKKKGYGIKEVPIRWINSPESRVDPVKDSLQMLADLVRIRFAVGKMKGKGA
jgi:dolichyl-phosphate beta-glucosyltransferase